MALIELRSHERLLTESMMSLEHLASTDELTGLLNRRALFERLETEIERSRRYASPLSLVLLDLDHFKQINDTHGHQGGDAVLRAVGTLISATKRTLDIGARYGGEELCILLPQTSIEGAFSFAETLRGNISELKVEYLGQALAVTASLGVSSTGISKLDAKQLLALSDKAMYAAKREGRNRVVLA
jgi:diguanylate cyclase (GGDEF)-like protein